MKESSVGIDGEAGPRDLRQRTKEFGLRIVRLYVALPKRGEGKVITIVKKVKARQ